MPRSRLFNDYHDSGAALVCAMCTQTFPFVDAIGKNRARSQLYRHLLVQHPQMERSVRKIRADTAVARHADLAFDCVLIYRWEHSDGTETGLLAARMLYESLVSFRLVPFLDRQHLRPGEDFAKRVSSVMAQSRAVVLLLRPGDLDRCVEKDDVLAFEIREAVALVRRGVARIVVVLLGGAQSLGAILSDQTVYLRLSKRLRADLDFLSTHYLCSLQMATVDDYRGWVARNIVGVVRSAAALLTPVQQSE
jgi:hypothetical protein